MNKKNGLSRYRQKTLIRAFAVDLTAVQTAQLLGFSRTTVNRYFSLFRTAIARHQAEQKALFIGTVEVDESFFGALHPRGRLTPHKRGHGTSKQPVFGIFERGGRVYTEIIPDAKAKTIQGIIRGRVGLSAVLMSDGYRAYDGLVDVGYDRHLHINKSRHFAQNGVHVNGIESFWSFTKRRLAKFNGVRRNFELHLKECEWR